MLDCNKDPNVLDNFESIWQSQIEFDCRNRPTRLLWVAFWVNLATWDVHNEEDQEAVWYTRFGLQWMDMDKCCSQTTDDGVGRWTAKFWQILAKFRKGVASSTSDYVARELAGWFRGRIGTVTK
jgi:hypothetical protein